MTGRFCKLYHAWQGQLSIMVRSGEDRPGYLESTGLFATYPSAFVHARGQGRIGTRTRGIRSLIHSFIPSINHKRYHYRNESAGGRMK